MSQPMHAPYVCLEAVERLKGVFLEIPCTRLTVGDASRLAGVDHPLCQEVMTALEDARFFEARPRWSVPVSRH